MITICLTKIPHSNNQTLCKELIQFPTVPVLLNHIRSLYNQKNYIDLKVNLPLLLDHTCYDRQLCDFLTPTFFFESYFYRKKEFLFYSV